MKHLIIFLFALSFIVSLSSMIMVETYNLNQASKGSGSYRECLRDSYTDTECEACDQLVKN